jgi:hypothetical protein
MFYLFEIAYKFRVVDSTADWYGISQVVAKELPAAKEVLTNYGGSVRSCLELKVLKVTPITQSFITYSTNISETIYHQFECIEEKCTSMREQICREEDNKFRAYADEVSLIKGI